MTDTTNAFARRLHALQRRLKETMIRDRFRLRRRLQRLERGWRASRSDRKRLDELERALNRSIEHRRRRRRAVPQVTVDPELPIAAKADEIAGAIERHQVIIVCGETGSGKSTQLPKLCLQVGRGVAGMIGHTQPRRIAARSIAARIASELGTRTGDLVGFKMRFAEAVGPDTLIKVMTDGILLAETQSDRFLEQYDTLIIDEAHERSLNIDFLLGYLRRILPRRNDLKLLVTSATLDAERFATFFADPNGQPAPVIRVEGRTYPVEVRYRPLSGPRQDRSEAPPPPGGPTQPPFTVGPDTGSPAEPLHREHSAEAPACASSSRDVSESGEASGDRRAPAGFGAESERAENSDEDAAEWDLPEAISRAVDELFAAVPGDILIFMPTERDIHELSGVLRARARRRSDPLFGTEVLPLYARLSQAEQNRVFAPHAGRRIVIATNVAESSLTVPGIRGVIDTGTARISRYSARSRMQRLPVEPISQASAEQRKGRCGRVGPGVCIRLYSEDDLRARERFTPPEIQRTNLAAVILQTRAMRLGQIESFPFLDPPRPAAIAAGYKTLFELGALDEQRRITPLGKRLAQLPVDPRIGRMVLAAHDEGSLAEVLVIAAGLEVRDPRERPLERQAAAEAAHARFADERSDFVGYLKLWDFFQQLKAKLSRNQLRRACRENFLSYNRLREWEDIYRQLLDIVRELGWKPGKRRDDYAAIHRALLAGLLANVAQRGRGHEYSVAAGGTAVLWPGSGLFARRPAWVVAAELVETSRRFLRTVAEIDVDWIEPLAEHMVRRHYSEPHWSQKRGTTVAFERVTLLGLTIVPRRQVRYVPIDPATSRTLMIRDGLVADRMDREFEFLAHNRDVIRRLEQARAKLRQQQPLPSEEELFALYDRGIPADVCDSRQLWTWWRRRATAEQKAALLLDPGRWQAPAEETPPSAFPDAVAVQHLRLPVSYAFEPGEETDGLTLRVPAEALRQLDERLLRWLVPGLLEENITALIRSLPKELRRHFVPAPDTARQIAAGLRFGEGDFLQVVADRLRQLGGVPVRPQDFRLERLPPHLQWNIEVLDADGKTLARGRDLAELRRALGAAARSVPTPAAPDPRWHKDGITNWEWEELPESVTRRQGDSQVTAFPALLDRGDSVALRLIDTQERAAAETRRGVRRLFWLARRRQVAGAVRTVPHWDRLKLQAVGLPDAERLERALEELIVQRAYLHDGKVPRGRAAFDARLHSGDQRLPVAVQEVTGLITQLLPAYHQAIARLEELAAAQRSLFAATVEDVRAQIGRLVTRGFLTETPWGWLQQFPRYFRAIRYRLDKVAGGEAGRDRQLLQQYRPFEERFRQRAARLQALGIEDPLLLEYRWMLEEYRVSLFAQPLGTAVKVSPVRLDRLWARLRPIA